ncbi:hypothetical protein Xen7305DRAFT_00035780 [Xenococcus sp. PCC 7305]|uniref:DUF4832 domain-containing protein n=1 Tax=Xenococcus sp. PCC 7305 TaxID=102125 RepID=UPI0002ACA63B|nr:DUF4832 domain-containing protein [Xenococcus sp. PCC 7305]ELS03854.1 hypothetical protein Xen7305DRAFT_00035780 [Xenococcus sp. PCC 7305]
MLYPRKFGLMLIIISMITIYQKVDFRNDMVTNYYRQSDRDFPNPERGFFVSFDPWGNDTRPPLKLDELKQLRERNITVARRYYLIDDFRDEPLSQKFLDKVQSDFTTARKAGVKLIIRFTYNWLGGGDDEPKETILAHLEQLRPVLEQNYDVIAYMEPGFIGYWGEWHSSTHGLDKDPEARKEILFKALSVLPPERMVTIRYTHYKRDSFNDYQPITAKEAFDGTKKSRTGSYNNCFLASIDDEGTYSSTQSEKITAQKQFLHQDNLYVVQGGEVCRYNPPRTDCPTAVKELAQMRWSLLNLFPVSNEYLYQIFQDWQEQGCYEEIAKRLGYRFRLIESTATIKSQPGGVFALNFQIENQGWASLYNPRKVELVLRSSQTGQEYVISIDHDPRFWQPGTKNDVEVKANLPSDITPGDYEVFLNLPDPTPGLTNRPEYSIRLANQNLWEENTGYNSLQHRLTIATPVEIDSQKITKYRQLSHARGDIQ